MNSAWQQVRSDVSNSVPVSFPRDSSRLYLRMCVGAINEVSEIDEIAAAAKTRRDFRAFPRRGQEIWKFVGTAEINIEAHPVRLPTARQHENNTSA